MRNHRRSASRRLVAVAVAAAAAVAGCGISDDDGPRELRDDQRQPLVAADPSDSPREGTTTRLYLLAPASQTGASMLQLVGRDVPPNAESVFTALFEGLSPAERAAQLRTAIPEGTELRAARLLTPDTLSLDVSEQFLSATGSELIDALAQIVYTANRLELGLGVRLSVEGVEPEWPTESGRLVERALTAFDFPDHSPSSQPDYPAIPSPAARELVAPTP